jgi:hypothetical protein
MVLDPEVVEVFQSLARIKVGDGRKVFFWKDHWINGRLADQIAPLVFSTVSTRRRNSRLIAEALLENEWLADIDMDLSVEGCAQCVRLWEEIEAVPRDSQIPDSFFWTGSASGTYSAKDTYRMLCQGSTQFNMYEAIWKSFAPPKGKIFAWLAVRYRLWTSDRRQRHGLQENIDPCAVCLQEEDTVDHIIMQCPYARQAWFGCLTAAGLNIVEPGRESRLEPWWDAARSLVCKKDRKSFDTLVLLTAWRLWKQRNARVFGNTAEQCNTTELLRRIADEFNMWKLARVGGRLLMPRE